MSDARIGALHSMLSKGESRLPGTGGRKGESALSRSRRARTIIGVGLGLALLSAALVGASQSASGAAATVRFAAMPKKTLPGKTVTVAISGPTSKDICALSVLYSGGVEQTGLRSVKVASGRATWRWRVPVATRPGPVRLLATCSQAGRASGTFVVQALPSKIDVLKSGFSIRTANDRSEVSYGVVLANRSATSTRSTRRCSSTS